MLAQAQNMAHCVHCNPAGQASRSFPEQPALIKSNRPMLGLLPAELVLLVLLMPMQLLLLLQPASSHTTAATGAAVSSSRV